MILRVSINARDPRHVAEVLAQILDCRIVAAPGGWTLRGANGPDLEITSRHETSPLADESRVALSTSRTIAEVFAVAGREGWPARYRRSQGSAGTIELLIEGDRIVEVLTAEMQADYREKMQATD